MPATLPTQRAAAAAMPREATPLLATRTLAWLAEHPVALVVVVDSVWDTLAELEAADHHPPLAGASATCPPQCWPGCRHCSPATDLRP